MMKKSTEGFTLIELVVGILCATLITGAAMSLMLMGLRNAQSLTDANTNLQNSRIILTMVEKLASEGVIQKIDFEDVSAGSPDDRYDWILLDESSEKILHYSHNEQIIYSSGNTALMKNVTSSTIKISEAPLSGSLLSCSITTEEGRFETTVYCRSCEFDTTKIIWPDNSKENHVIFAPEAPPATNNDSSSSSIKFDGTITGGRTAFLSTLLSQYGSNGKIIGTSDQDSDQHFSNWYNPLWEPKDTAWCACFVSWGADFIGKAGVISEYLGVVPRFAHVDCGWNEWNNIEDKQYRKMFDYKFKRGEGTPMAGDLIFFDWDNNSTATATNLDHVGVVLYVGNGYVYTIEGNSEATKIADGRVAIQRYRLDSEYIYGYAVLDWKNP